MNFTWSTIVRNHTGVTGITLNGLESVLVAESGNGFVVVEIKLA